MSKKLIELYKEKYYIPVLEILRPFILIIDGLYTLILLLTPFRSNIMIWYLKKLLRKQIKKRINRGLSKI